MGLQDIKMWWKNLITEHYEIILEFYFIRDNIRQFHNDMVSNFALYLHILNKGVNVEFAAPHWCDSDGTPYSRLLQHVKHTL